MRGKVNWVVLYNPEGFLVPVIEVIQISWVILRASSYVVVISGDL